jgi:hypothetical protein
MQAILISVLLTAALAVRLALPFVAAAGRPRRRTNSNG